MDRRYLLGLVHENLRKVNQTRDIEAGASLAKRLVFRRRMTSRGGRPFPVGPNEVSMGKQEEYACKTDLLYCECVVYFFLSAVDVEQVNESQHGAVKLGLEGSPLSLAETPRSGPLSIAMKTTSTTIS